MNPPAPLTTAPVAAATTPESPAALVTTRPLRILLIEDDPADARLTQERLRDSGHTCDVADALTWVTAQRLDAVDCALIDLNLPDASGLQALRRVRELAPELATVVLTGFDDEDTGLGALRAGAQDCLSKQHADRHTIDRAVQFAVTRKQVQLTADSRALHELDLTDDVVQQLFAIGLGMSTSRRRSASDPDLAARIADHMHELQLVIQELRDTMMNAPASAWLDQRPHVNSSANPGRGRRGHGAS